MSSISLSYQSQCRQFDIDANEFEQKIIFLSKKGYQFEKIIGKGGFSLVISSYSEVMSKIVSIKCMKINYNADIYQNEVKSLEKLKHRKEFIQIYDSFYSEDLNIFFIVSEFCDCNLREIIKQNKLSKRQIYTISQQLLSGLSVLHSNEIGIIHLDIKPENILYCKEQNLFKLADFGISKQIKNPLVQETNSSIIGGTFQYISYEVLNQIKPINIKADIYSLGVTLLELCLGHQIDSDKAIILRQDRIKEILPQNSPYQTFFDQIIMNMIRKQEFRFHASHLLNLLNQLVYKEEFESLVINETKNFSSNKNQAFFKSEDNEIVQNIQKQSQISYNSQKDDQISFNQKKENQLSLQESIESSNQFNLETSQFSINVRSKKGSFSVSMADKSDNNNRKDNGLNLKSNFDINSVVDGQGDENKILNENLNIPYYQIYKQVRFLCKSSFADCFLLENVIDGKVYFSKNIIFDSKNDIQDSLMEVELLSQIDHPNIVKLIDHYLTEKCLYIILEYIDGVELFQLIKKQKNKHFEEEQILQWFAQICQGVSYLHKNNIIHRDIKSQNVMVDKNNVCKLIDFNISKKLKSKYSFLTTIVGTPYYLSPEIIEQKPYSFATDIWALGVLLYELCTLKMPFNSKQLNGLALKIVRGLYFQISYSQYSAELRDLIQNMLQTNPQKRYTIDDIISLPIIQNQLKQNHKLKKKKSILIKTKSTPKVSQKKWID